jgi:NAD+ kinase
MIDSKSLSKKENFYFIVFDEANKSAATFAKKINLELGIKSMSFHEVCEHDLKNTDNKIESLGIVNKKHAYKKYICLILGGDGFLLRVVHFFLNTRNIFFYGINFGTVGFLLNDKKHVQDLISSIEEAEVTEIFPLVAIAKNTDGQTKTLFAINEVSLLRQTNQASHISISLGGRVYMKNLVADGVVISTACGSTAYNFSVHGPIFHPYNNAINICPISSFRPRHWRGALISDKFEINISILDTNKRPTSLSCDFYFEPDIANVKIKIDTSKPIGLLFDREKTLEQKILEEQFTF